MMVYVDYVHNCHESEIRLASVWVTSPSYYEKTKDCPPWGARNPDEVKNAVKIVGPVASPVAKQVFLNVCKALEMLNLEVVPDETSDD